MKLIEIHEDFSDWPTKIHDLVLVVRALKAIRITLPPLQCIPTTPIAILGWNDCQIELYSVESNGIHAIPTPIGSVIFRGPNSRTVVTNIKGEAWHVASNVALQAYEQKED